jgi:hypothetical protein
MPTEFLPIPEWPWWQNAGVGVAVADVNGDGRPDLVVLVVDDPPGANAASYRLGRGLDQDGILVGGWGAWTAIPDWFSWQNADCGLAVADLDGDGRRGLVVFMIDAPEGPNAAYYRVGWRLDAAGAVTGGWSDWTPIPDWFAWENQGGDIAVADLDGDGRPELVVVMVDAPEGANAAYYRVGWRLDATGAVTGGWSDWTPIPDWFSWENQGAGAAVADLDGDGRSELLVFQVDNPPGQNGGYYTIGWGLDGTGRATQGWGPWSAVPDWRFWENDGAAVAPVDLGGGRPHLVMVAVDDPPEQNQGYSRVLELVTDLDAAATTGVWRLLDFDAQVLPIHAALLRTGEVLFFAGSSNNPANLAGGLFRTRVWQYPSASFAAPDTPIDLFCCGQGFLADGRLLAAGGTEQYDPFHGLRDALVFDPAEGTWAPVPDMAGGRWYPALLELPDGRMLAISGLGEDGNLNLVPEVYADGGGWAPLPSPGPWPLYAHLFVLIDGRIFYSGGQYGGNNGTRPSIWDLAGGSTTVVPGLPGPDMRNQSASVLLPPAQRQRVMIMGGGGYDMHNQAPAVADTAIVDLSAAAPAYAPAAPLHTARMHLNAVLLPDRTVLVSGGAAMEETAAMAALSAELYDPDADAWTVLAAARVPRLYHSIALLLPDGRVVTAGSNPQRTQEELRIEVFWPPYLFRGPRPTCTLEVTEAGYGETIAADCPEGPGLGQVSLLRPGATTHSADNEQRLIDVPFRVTGQDRIECDLPTSRNLAPPGWYMLFAVTTAGVPSQAAWLHLS